MTKKDKIYNKSEIKVVSAICKVNFIEAENMLSNPVVLIAEGNAYEAGENKVMFMINYRVVDDFEELKNISSKDFDNDWNQITGFFQICFGEHEEGCYYHENPLRADEFGEELLDYWFDQLLCTIELLEKTDYVAFREIETVKRWLEFKRDGETVTINVVLNSSEKALLITKPFHEFLYVEPENFACTWDELKKNVIKQTGRFFNELRQLNPQLMESEKISGLLKKYQKLL